MSTTIELEFTNMSNQGQPPQAVRVVISQDGGQELHNSSGSKFSPRATRRTKVTRDTVKTSKKMTGFELNQEFSCYDPNMFTITAYLPNEGMEGEKRLKLHCYPGMTVREVIDSQIPSVTQKTYVVYQFPSRALLNPEKEAIVLQDQEIWIEPAHSQGLEEVGDERLAVVKELYRTEDAYLEHLRNIFDIYIEPMRSWGMSQSDMNTLFLALSHLCDILMNFFSELELAIKSWNTNTTLIGGLFTQYPSFWDMYVDYAQSYTLAMRLLKQKRKDEPFSKFLDIKRGAAMHTLESLMLLPVQRVSDYQRYLTQLLDLTPRGHPDYQNIRVTVARTDEIIQARADELVYLQNESKLEQVQIQFPNDQLFLLENLDKMDTSSHKRSKSITQPPTPYTKQHNPPSRYKSSTHCFPTESTDSHSGNRKNLRMYVQEGPVKLLIMNKQGLFQSQERFLFLFSDLLLIAKPTSKSRSQHHRMYKLKTRLRLAEMWVSETVEPALPSDDSRFAFTIGWPIINCTAVFSSEPERTLWLSALSKNIKLQKQLAVSDSVSIQIANMAKPMNQQINNIPEFLQVHVSEDCTDVLKKALKHFQINESPSEFQLWVKLARDEKEELLRGYECIFAIQCNHNRQQMDLSGETRPQQLEFVVRKKSQSITSSSSRAKMFKKWIAKRNPGGKDSKPKQVKMFAIPLEDLIINNQLPEKLQEMLIRLWVDGPTTFGIFRLNGNAKRIREVKENIDGRKLHMVDLSEEGIHVISSLLKELLRNVPGGVLSSIYYTEFVATNDIKDVDTRVQHIKKVLNKLPQPNQVFLRYLFPLLYHICEHENVNQMTSTNLAICFAPSLLEPEYSLAVIKNEAPTLVEFMIKHAMEIYNNELPELFRQLDTAPSEVSESERESERRFVPLKDNDEETEVSEDGRGKYYTTQHRRGFSMDTGTSASEDSLDEDETVPHRLPLHHTASDSKVDDLVIHNKSGGGVGRVTLASDRSDGLNTGIEGDSEEEEDTFPQLNWPYRQNIQNRIRHTAGNSDNRRRSVATQSINKHFSQDVQPPRSQSPRSRTNSNIRNSPMFPHRIDHMDSDGSVRSSGHRSDGGTRQGNKKRRKAGHSNSFSKASDLPFKEASIPQSTSFSYYDSLLPLERTRSHTVPSTNAPPTHSSLVNNDDSVGVARSSNQSVNSRGSVSSGGTPSRNIIRTQPTAHSESPDTLTDVVGKPFAKIDSESIKHAISHRFGLSDRATPSDRTHIIKSNNATSTSPPTATNVNSSMSNDKLKRVESVETTSSIDDRPEAERHLNSLPRDYKDAHTSSSSLGRRSTLELLQLGYNETGSRLTILDNSSDTESSPSRTLNRPDKLQEVASSPYSMRSLPQRYSKLSDTTHTSMSSLRSMDSFDRPPSIEEHTPTSPISQDERVLSSTPQPVENRTRSSLSTYSTSDQYKQSDWKTKQPPSPIVKSSSELMEPLKTKSPLITSSKPTSSQPVSIPHVGVRKLGSTPEHRSRSMPDSNRRLITKSMMTSGQYNTVKTVRVIRYELPVPKKIRRINLRAYNTNK